MFHGPNMTLYLEFNVKVNEYYMLRAFSANPIQRVLPRELYYALTVLS